MVGKFTSRPRTRAASRLGAALFGALMVSLCCWATGANAQSLKKTVKKQVVVQLADTAYLNPMLQYLRNQLGYRPTVVDKIPARPVYLLSVKEADVVTTVDLLNDREQEVVFSERNELVQLYDWLRDPVTQAKRNSVFAIGATVTWSEPAAVAGLLRLSVAHTFSRGAGMRVAILDTGSDLDHPDFIAAPDPVTFPAFGLQDFIDNDADPTEGGTPITNIADYGHPSNVGHGTHVSGIVHRVAPEAALMIGRVLDPTGTGTTWLAAKGIFWAVDPNADGLATSDGAHVINLSLATPVDTMVVRLATNVVTCASVPAAGMGFSVDRTRCGLQGPGKPFSAVVVAAAGNDASSTLLEYPAAYATAGLIAVAASDNNPGLERKLAFFSNSGAFVDVAAPGAGISSQFFDDQYAHISGTSMAAPMVSGLAALLRATRGAWTAANVASTIKSRAVTMCDGSAFRHIDVAGTLGAAPLGACPSPPAP